MISGKDITVVIPVRNRPELIVRCLDSIQAQNVLPGRVIVVDNGSTDHTMERVREWESSNRGKGMKIDLLQEDIPGACAARNRGLQAVESEWVLFFDSDDTMRPELVGSVIPVAPGNDIVCWKMHYHSAGRDRVEHSGSRHVMRRHLFNSVLSTQRYMVRTKFVKEAGGWGALSIWNDWELGFRLLGLSPRVTHVGKVLVDVYNQKASITGSAYSEKIGEREHTIDVMESIAEEGEVHGHRASWPPYTLRGLKRAFDFVRVRLAADYRREGAVEAAKKLLHDTLMKSGMCRVEKLWLRILYFYMSHGGRAAHLLWR